MAWDLEVLRAEINAEFRSYEEHQLRGMDLCAFAAQHSVDRWASYEEKRRARMKRDPAFREARRAQWRKSNAKRRAKRKGQHLGNRARAALADDIRRGRKTVAEVRRAEGLGAKAAEEIATGQLELFADP